MKKAREATADIGVRARASQSAPMMQTQLREQADEAERLARTLRRIADRLDGGARDVNLTSPPLLFPPCCVPIKSLAANLRCSEKTARKIAGQIPGARFEFGGRIYFDQAVIAESYRVLPCSPAPDSGAMGDNEVSDEDSHE